MPISGLVITLTDAQAEPAVRQTINQQEPRLQCGEVQDIQLPAVLETEDAQASRTIHDWLLTVPGVVNVDVVFVGLDDDK